MGHFLKNPRFLVTACGAVFGLLISVASPVHAGGTHLALFNGITVSSGASHYTIGGELEFKVSPFLGIGPIVEVITTNPSETLVLGAAHLHLPMGWRVYGGAGTAIASGHSEFSLRAAVAYDISLASLTISPSAAIDSVGGTAAGVFGISLGVGI